MAGSLRLSDNQTVFLSFNPSLYVFTFILSDVRITKTSPFGERQGESCPDPNDFKIKW